MTTGDLTITSAPASTGAGAQPADSGRRYHSLDFLRATLMFAVIIFHAATPARNLVRPGLDVWPESQLLAIVMVGNNGFQMPIFFILSGFFAALLLTRRTPGAFAANRLLHIGVPLIVGWAVLSPFVGAGVAYALAERLLASNTALDIVWGLTKRGEYFFLDQTMHLWFLFYLLLFYALALAVQFLARLPIVPRMPHVARHFSTFLESSWRLPILVAITAGLLYVQPPIYGSAPASFTPDIRFLILYGSFFAFGCLLFAVRDDLSRFTRAGTLHLVAGIGLLIVYTFVVEEWFKGGQEASWKALALGLNAVLIWALFFGLLAVFMRHFDRPIPVVRYVADASYWCYLLHLPLVIWLTALLNERGLPDEALFAVVASITVLVCFLTYDLFVRWTYLGVVLQGRRYRSLISTALQREGSPSPALEQQA